jgi:DNA polymerase
MPAPKLLFYAEPPPAITSLKELARVEHECRRCPLYEHATQAVPGEGRRQAHLMLVGEQPGDKEDIAGKPFVGRSTRRWRKPAFRARKSSSPTRSSISSTRCAASGAWRSLLGRPVTITKVRGAPLQLADGTAALVTIHPSLLLRIEDRADKAREYRAFVADLRQGAKFLHQLAA